LANTGFQTVYNYIGLEPRREAMHWQFGEMKFGELEQFWHAFNVARVWQRQLGFLVTRATLC